MENLLKRLNQNFTPGGWSASDINSEKIQHITKWIIMSMFGNQPDYSIVYAEQQVVAGMNYKIVLTIDISGKKEFWEFLVYDHFGKYSITNSRIL
jgi:hypothetical protein